MSITVIALLFLATAPIHLLPAILVVFLRCRDTAWVILANLGIWLGFPLSQELHLPIHLNLVAALVLWLLLLRFVLTRERARAAAERRPGLPHHQPDPDPRTSPDIALERARDR